MISGDTRGRHVAGVAARRDRTRRSSMKIVFTSESPLVLSPIRASIGSADIRIPIPRAIVRKIARSFGIDSLYLSCLYSQKVNMRNTSAGVSRLNVCRSSVLSR